MTSSLELSGSGLGSGSVSEVSGLEVSGSISSSSGSDSIFPESKYSRDFPEKKKIKLNEVYFVFFNWYLSHSNTYYLHWSVCFNTLLLV